MLLKFLKSKSPKFFLGFVFFATVATTFQMILLVQFVFVLVTVFAFKISKLPNIKTTLISLSILCILFAPMIIFDFRNQHITFNSLINYGGESSLRESGSLLRGLKVYFTQMRNHISLSTININFLWSQLLIIIFIISGVILKYKKKREKVKTIFLLSWAFMSLPLIWVSPGNPQYYVGIGLGWIMLFSLSLKTFWETKRLKAISILAVMLFTVGTTLAIYNLKMNKDVFFRTFQDDLNYADQQSVLNFIHQDSNNQSYRLVSFTIPSLHPEAWDYLHQYFYPKNSSDNAKIVYIVIEKYVYPVWEEKWINDLGETRLIFEKKFGLLRLQKREIID